MNRNTENRFQPPSLIMNEKTLAEYLGQTEYEVKQLREKCGLPCLPRNGRHKIQYYWPVVDEYFRQQSKPFDSSRKSTENQDCEPVTDTNIINPESKEPVVPKMQILYKPMEPV